MSPSGSLALPAKVTDCPAVMVTLDAGCVMVPLGGLLAGAFTVIVRVSGEGSARPWLSVAVKVTV